jgi:hypothetical protein
MSMQLVALVGVLILGLASVALVYLLGMRAKSPLARSAMRPGGTSWYAPCRYRGMPSHQNA